MAIAAPQPRVLADVFAQTWVRNLVLVVGGAAFIGLSAQIYFYLPWNTAVPVTLQTFAVVLSAAALGSVRGALAMLVYAVVGVLGVPWFAEHSSGYSARTFWRSAGLMVLGNLIIYLFGATWLKYNLGIPWFGSDSAWAYGVKDFLVGDAIKIVAAAGLLPLTWRGLRKAGLTE